MFPSRSIHVVIIPLWQFIVVSRTQVDRKNQLSAKGFDPTSVILLEAMGYRSCTLTT